MAFLRSVCVQRTTKNLIYNSRSHNNSRHQHNASSNSNNNSCNSKSQRSAATTNAITHHQLSSNVNKRNNENLVNVTCNFYRHYHRHHHHQEQQTAAATATISQRQLQQQHALQHKQLLRQVLFHPMLNAAQFYHFHTDESKRKSAVVMPSSNMQRDPLDTSFDNPRDAFKSKTTWELIRAYVVYLICSNSTLVENNLKIMKYTNALLGDKLFAMLMKSTFYGHFVAGEDQIKIVPTLERLRSFGVKPILDYSVEEDISQEQAEKLEVASSVSSTGDKQEPGSLKQYHVEKTFADRRYKVSSARTYFYMNEATCERNMEIFIKCLEAVSVEDRKEISTLEITGATFGTGITAIKLTALGRPQLLLQLSEVIMTARKYMIDLVGGQGNVLSHHKTINDLEKYFTGLGDNTNVKEFLKNVTSDKEGILHLFPWHGICDENSQLSDTFRLPDPKTGQMRRLISQISPKEEEMFRNMIRRMNMIARAAAELDVRIMIDAEQTYFQPAISRITLEMMRKYNKDKAIVFNTYQCYLRNALQEVTTDLEQAKRQNFYFGAKLVRGAYMDQERARAQAMGYADPINPNYESTTEMYHNTLTECLRRIKLMKESKGDFKRIGIMVASHNEDTVRFAIEQMKNIGISPEDKVICFGQLFGMCDYITFPLGQAGYSAYKYIPYGPVKEVLPYLSRRAVENKGVLKKLKKEKRLLLSEIRRRIFTGQLFSKPKGNYVPV